MKKTYITCEGCNIHYPTDLMVRKKKPDGKEIFLCFNCEFEKGKQNRNKTNRKNIPKTQTMELTIPPAPNGKKKLAMKCFFAKTMNYKGYKNEVFEIQKTEENSKTVQEKC